MLYRAKQAPFMCIREGAKRTTDSEFLCFLLGRELAKDWTKWPFSEHCDLVVPKEFL